MQLATIEEIKHLEYVAKKFHEAGALPKQLDNPEKLLMTLMAGRDLGLNPTQSINGLYIVNGKITVYGETAILLMTKAGYLIDTVESTSKLAHVKISKGERVQEYKYTIEEAINAGLTEGGMGIWRKYPRQMLMYKAIAMGRKFFATECLGGYSIKEELDGEIVNINEPVDKMEVLDGFSC